jgi:hypothetical protein
MWVVFIGEERSEWVKVSGRRKRLVKILYGKSNVYLELAVVGNGRDGGKIFFALRG